MNKIDLPTILLVDDEKNMLNALSNILSDEGYEIMTAMDGVEALDILKIHQAKISLIITNMKMPKLDGCEMIEKLGTIMTIPIAVIILSAYYTTENHGHLKLGMVKNVLLFEVISKPPHVVELLKHVSEAIKLCKQRRQLHKEEIRHLYLQYN